MRITINTYNKDKVSEDQLKSYDVLFKDLKNACAACSKGIYYIWSRREKKRF